MSIFFGLYTTDRAALIADFSELVDSLSITTNEHGFSELTAHVRLAALEAFARYDRSAAYYLVVKSFGATLWEGRLEDAAIVDDGVNLLGLGYQRALSDTLHTALWSVASYAPWWAWSQDDRSTAWSERYEIDNNNRLFIAPQKNATLGNTGGNKAGTIGLVAPAGGVRKIVACSFSYEMLAPAGWAGGLNRYTGSPAGTVSNVWSLTATGVLQTGTQNLTFTADDVIAFYFQYPAADAVYAGETGAAYLKITNLRVKTTTSAAVYADEIAAALLAEVYAVNPTQISGLTTLIESPLVDLTDQLYEDLRPAEILNRLIVMGDNQTPPRRWEWGVYDGQHLHLRPRGSAGRAWYVDALRLDLTRTLDALYNSVYSIYADENGVTQRTAVSTNADSVASDGLTRTGYINSDTTSSTQAGIERDAALSDTYNPRPRSALEFDALYDATGARWPLWACRSGDTITLRNLPPQISASVDRIRTFVVSETRYDVMADKLEATPESPLPRLEVLLARKEVGI